MEPSFLRLGEGAWIISHAQDQNKVDLIKKTVNTVRTAGQCPQRRKHHTQRATFNELWINLSTTATSVWIIAIEVYLHTPLMWQRHASTDELRNILVWTWRVLFALAVITWINWWFSWPMKSVLGLYLPYVEGVTELIANLLQKNGISPIFKS